MVVVQLNITHGRAALWANFGLRNIVYSIVTTLEIENLVAILSGGCSTCGAGLEKQYIYEDTSCRAI